MFALRFIIVALAVLALSAGAAAAAPVKGDDSSVSNKDCSLVKRDGSVHFGKCGNVCKGKEVKEDRGGKYGGQYYCTQAAITPINGQSTSTGFPRLELP